MREVLTDRGFIVSKIVLALKILLALALVFFFLPLIVLPFFNHASADDYFYGVALYKQGFLHYQVYIYNNWSGRFSTTLLSSVFLANHFLYDHYYLHSLIFLGLNFIASFLLLNALNKYVLKKQFNTAKTFLCAVIFTALTILCSPEISGLIFWFSSAIVYYAGLIFIQAELLLFVLIFYSSNRFTKAVCYVLLPLIVFITNGFSEVFVLMQLCILFLLYAGGFFKKTSLFFLLVLIVFFIASAALSFLAPGNFVRGSTIPTLKLKNGIVAILFSALEVMADIFKNPLAWFAIVISFFSGYSFKANFSKHFKQKSIYYLLILCIAFFAFLLLAISEGVIGLKGRIVPDRCINIVCWFCLLLLCAAAFIGGISCKTRFLIFRFYKGELSVACYLILILCLCSNNYINSAYKSMLSAPLYDSILTERENVFKDASNNKTIAVVKNYDLALKELIEKEFPDASTTYLKWAQQKPELIFNNNGDSDEQSIRVLKVFYGVDSVIIKK